MSIPVRTFLPCVSLTPNLSCLPETEEKSKFCPGITVLVVQFQYYCVTWLLCGSKKLPTCGVFPRDLKSLQARILKPHA